MKQAPRPTPPSPAYPCPPAPLPPCSLPRAPLQYDWRVGALVRLVKAWARRFLINDSAAGTLNSFALTLMASHAAWPFALFFCCVAFLFFVGCV